MSQFLIFLSLIFSISLLAESPEEKGIRLAKQIESANNGFVGEVSNMEMILIDAYKNQITRKMEGKVLEVEGDGDKSLSLFLNPKDVKGTKMLTWTHKSEDDKQWLYLPSLRRVKRISSSNKSSSFLGSEFSFEDLGSQEPEKYHYKFIKDDKFNGEDVFIMERKSKEKSGYSKQIMTVSKAKLNPLKIEYYDRKGELLKRAEFMGYKPFKIKSKTLYRPERIHMKNLQTLKESVFVWKERKLGVQLSDREFSKRSLK